MRILEIVLDGFKSYASRTVISDFDEHFNAITGFNGSGKSNILDAICFVLGITTLSTVRVANKQEYIYKNGQAGISKANVTILFDNSDKNRCHEAYKKYEKLSVRREYAVGGATKCTINGTTVTNEKVLQLFSMSGLNVNNANFLIMQGRITQVTNMKPNEILSLVEETAGTNAYEEIRKKTVKIVEKKDAKLMEIENILENDVMPIMEQLKKENEEYMKYREIVTQHEAIERKVKAAQYYEVREMIMNAEMVQKNYEEALKDIVVKKKDCKKHVSLLEKQRKELQEKELRLVEDGDKTLMDSLKTQKNSLDQELTRKNKEILTWQQTIHELEIKNEECSNFNSREGILAKKYNEDLEKVREVVADKRKEVESLRMKLTNMERGGNVEEDFAQNQIEELSRKIESIGQENQLKESQLAGYIRKLDGRKKELKDAEVHERYDFTEINKQISRLEREMKGFQSPSEASRAELVSSKNEIEGELMRMQNSMARFDSNKFSCNYSLPEPGFDRSRIKGRVITLITVKDGKYAQALESGAGGRLFSLVVDTDITGQLLLSKRTFGNVSILPNNKTQPVICQEDKKQAIYKTFGNKARLALDLVEHSQENRNTIGLVFGNFFVCETKEIAEKIAYDPNFRKRAVTLEGDSYNPEGTLSGGEAFKSSSLAEIIEYKKIESQLYGKQKELEEVRGKLNEFEKVNERFMNLKNELDMARNTKSSKEKSMQTSSSAKLANEIKEIEQQVEFIKGDVNSLREQRTELEKELSSLRRQSTGNPKDLIAKTLSKAESELKKACEGVKKLQDEINKIESKIESKGKEMGEIKEKIHNLNENLTNHLSEVQESTVKLQSVAEKLKQVQIKCESKYQELMRHKKASSELEQDLQKYTKDLENIINDRSLIEEKQKQIHKEAEANLKILEELESTYPYIPQMESEIVNFDKAQGREKLEMLQIEKDRLSKRVNKKVASTLDDHTKRYESLDSKKKLVVEDKEKLLDIIKDLDLKKQTCIQETWQLVDKNLGEIYSMLLPGASAKLENVDELSGLEMKVGFNGDWRSNLGELSGGQRSLLALSFILALLKVNPAPIYILDEIDAALDMSHTQNIGLMLKTHFSQSQFIVVSLKEGMFTNANVLFRTNFVEGRSTIERYTSNSSVKRR